MRRIEVQILLQFDHHPRMIDHFDQLKNMEDRYLVPRQHLGYTDHYHIR
jgi:hypothetical protein